MTCRHVPFVVMDFETTGLNPNTNHIIQVGLVLYRNASETASYSSLVNPGIPFHNQQFHGITQQEVSDAPTWRQVVPDVMTFLAQANTWAAYNYPFDGRFLLEECRRASVPVPNHVLTFDILKFMRYWLQGRRSYKLEDIARHLGVLEHGQRQTHQGLDDARLAGRALFKILDRLDKTRIPSPLMPGGGPEPKKRNRPRSAPRRSRRR